MLKSGSVLQVEVERKLERKQDRRVLEESLCDSFLARQSGTVFAQSGWLQFVGATTKAVTSKMNVTRGDGCLESTACG